MPDDSSTRAILTAFNRLRHFTVEEAAAHAETTPAEVTPLLLQWAEAVAEPKKDAGEWRIPPGRVASLLEAIARPRSEHAPAPARMDTLRMLHTSLDKVERAKDANPLDDRTLQRELRMAQRCLKAAEVDLLDRQVATDRRMASEQEQLAAERLRLNALLPPTAALASADLGSLTQRAIRTALLDWERPLPTAASGSEEFSEALDASRPEAAMQGVLRGVNGRLTHDVEVALRPAVRLLRLRGAVDEARWEAMRQSAIAVMRDRLQLQGTMSLVGPICVLAALLEAVELIDVVFRALLNADTLETMDRFSRQLCLASVARLAHSAMHDERLREKPNLPASVCLYFAMQQRCVPMDLPLLVPPSLCLPEADARTLMERIVDTIGAEGDMHPRSREDIDESAFAATFSCSLFMREHFDKVDPHIHRLGQKMSGISFLDMLLARQNHAIEVRLGNESNLYLQPKPDLKRRCPEFARVTISLNELDQAASELFRKCASRRQRDTSDNGPLTGLMRRTPPQATAPAPAPH